MNYKISFGEFADKTHEWLFFHAPWEVKYIVDNELYEDEELFSDEEADYFLELYNRATRLSGTCGQCRERPIRHLGLTYQGRGALGLVGYYCEECDYIGGGATAHYAASFFIDAPRLSHVDQLRITKEIRRIYIGMEGKLTQKKMEAFFRNDANFYDPTYGFFASHGKEIVNE